MRRAAQLARKFPHFKFENIVSFSHCSVLWSVVFDVGFKKKGIIITSKRFKTEVP